MKIYTRTGDSGSCSLASGLRVMKSSPRIDSYGTVDELNSWVGLCRAWAKDALPGAEYKSFDNWMAAIQHDLFNIGADLATPVDDRFDDMRIVSETEVVVLERLIDFCQSSLPQLSCFVLPAGTQLGSGLHVARTVCRRAERVTVALAALEVVNSSIVSYLNRLSDFLFVLARWTQHKCGVGDVPWSKQGGLSEQVELRGDNL
jgi:cob(I)alamin adenosyltransferase